MDLPFTVTYVNSCNGKETIADVAAVVAVVAVVFTIANNSC